MYNNFRYFCTHPFGYQMSEFDSLALKNGFCLIIHAEDTAAFKSWTMLYGLLDHYPDQIFVRCPESVTQGYLDKGFNVISEFTGSTSCVSPDCGKQIIAECLTLDEVKRASRDEYTGIIIRGSEAGGKAGHLNNFVFFQAASELTDLPLYVAGGIGKFAIGGLYAGGAAGVVLNEQLFLFVESPLSVSAREILLAIESDETYALTMKGFSFRFHRKTYSPSVNALLEYIDNEDPDIDQVHDYIKKHSALGFEQAENNDLLFGMGTDAVFACRFLREFSCFSGLVSDIPLVAQCPPGISAISPNKTLRLANANESGTSTTYPHLASSLAHALPP